MFVVYKLLVFIMIANMDESRMHLAAAAGADRFAM